MPDAKSPLLEKPEVKMIPKYSDSENLYVGAILTRLLNAKMNRDKSHPEFNDQTYNQYFSENERVANTYIVRDQTNKDFTVNSGTVEQKLYTIVAEINRLNLTGQVRAFDGANNDELYKLGTALTDIVEKTHEMEIDEEAKLMRQVELLKQGTVFIQDNWVTEYKVEKELDQKFNGKLDAINWSKKIVKAFDGPRKSILYGPGVYLGNIREFDMKKQPFIFTHKLTSYSEAKSRYGAKGSDGKDIWDRWQYVSDKRVTLVTQDSVQNTTVANGWALSDITDNMVEEIHYQDRFNNEYQIFLNGIPMLPVGFPLSAVSPDGEYNIDKQVLQVINAFFAYGRSFVIKTQQMSDLLDEMIRLLVLKTRKSIHPPYANISGRVISEQSLMPGAISMNIDPGSLVPIGTEGQGATASEYQMLKELRDAIDRVTVSPQIQGQASKSGTTAFEVQLLQQQAQKLIQLTVFAAALLEKKVTWLRLNLVLWRWFDPVDTKVDSVRKQLVDVYRTTNTNTTLQGRGNGVRKVIPIGKNEHAISAKDVFNMEEYHNVPAPDDTMRRAYTRDELGMPAVEIIFLDLEVLRRCKYMFFVEVEAKPKDTSNNTKLMFREELKDIAALQMMGAVPNVEELENTYAIIWNRRKEKMFGKPQQVLPPQQQQSQQGGAAVLNQNSSGVPASMNAMQPSE